VLLSQTGGRGISHWCQWGDIILDGPAPCIQLRAKTTKARREDSIPLRRDLAGKLRAAKPPFAQPTARVFRSAPKRETFTRDCVRAGIIKVDDHGRQIPDGRGRTLDRHALRVTFVSWMSRAGVSPRTAQVLARHTDIRLTMKTYTDPALLDARAAIESLPEIPTSPDEPDEVRATGTDDIRPKGVVPSVVLNDGESTRKAMNTADATPVAPSGESLPCNELRVVAQQFQIGGGGNRTRVPEHFRKGLYVHSRSICVSTHATPVDRLHVGPTRLFSRRPAAE
jgi:hypothetical protein